MNNFGNFLYEHRGAIVRWNYCDNIYLYRPFKACSRNNYLLRGAIFRKLCTT